LFNREVDTLFVTVCLLFELIKLFSKEEVVLDPTNDRDKVFDKLPKRDVVEREFVVWLLTEDKRLLISDVNVLLPVKSLEREAIKFPNSEDETLFKTCCSANKLSKLLNNDVELLVNILCLESKLAKLENVLVPVLLKTCCSGAEPAIFEKTDVTVPVNAPVELYK
jgi:hypothetical protein